MLRAEDRAYTDSMGNLWIIRKREATAFEVWPQDKGRDCIEADVAASLKSAKELIEHMATADATERWKWQNGKRR
jgi:hypothetical protein